VAFHSLKKQHPAGAAFFMPVSGGMGFTSCGCMLPTGRIPKKTPLLVPKRKPGLKTELVKYRLL
jgi:hypothetical protein